MRSNEIVTQLEVSDRRLRYWREQLQRRDIINPVRVDGGQYDFSEEEVAAFRKLKVLLESGVDTVPDAAFLIVAQRHHEDENLMPRDWRQGSVQRSTSPSRQQRWPIWSRIWLSIKALFDLIRS